MTKVENWRLFKNWIIGTVSLMVWVNLLLIPDMWVSYYVCMFVGLLSVGVYYGVKGDME